MERPGLGQQPRPARPGHGPLSAKVSSDVRLRLERQAAQLLHRPEPLAPVDIVRRLGGVQAQQRRAAPLAIRARTAGGTETDVDRALHEERSIVWTWAMRGTLHFLAAEDVPWLLPLVAERQLSASIPRLAQLGVSRGAAERAVALIGRVLGRSGPLTRAELLDRVRRKGIVTEGQAGPHLIRLAALAGVACYGPARGREATLVAVADWLGARPALRDPAGAVVELAARYLGSHGPATPADFATWSGLGLTRARAAFAALGDRLLEMRAVDGSMWRLRSTEPDRPRGVVRLVPAFDPYLLGWKTRDLILPKAHERAIFPGGGILRPALVVDGLVAGGWSAERRGTKLALAVRPFSRTSTRIRAALEREVDEVKRFAAAADGATGAGPDG